MSKIMAYRFWFLLGICCLGVAIQLEAQEGSNPFDLKNRPNQEISTPSAPQQNNPFDVSSTNSWDTLVNERSANPTTPANPFDLNRNHRVNQENEEERPASPSTQVPGASDEENPFNKSRPSLQPAETTEIAAPTMQKPEKKVLPANESRDFLFWSLLTMLIFFALLVTLFRSLLGKIYRAFTNDNILKLLHREQGHFVTFPYLLFYLLFFISGGIFIFQIGHYFEVIALRFSDLTYCILIVAAVFVVKHFLLKLVGNIFPINREIRIYSFTIVIFSIILGIALIPFNVLMAYAPPFFAQIAVYLGLLAVFALYSFRSLRSLFIASKYLGFHKFHFFMYLCTVEIAPVVVLVKLFLLTTGIQ